MPLIHSALIQKNNRKIAVCVFWNNGFLVMSLQKLCLEIGIIYIHLSNFDSPNKEICQWSRYFALKISKSLIYFVEIKMYYQILIAVYALREK